MVPRTDVAGGGFKPLETVLELPRIRTIRLPWAMKKPEIMNEINQAVGLPYRDTRRLAAGLPTVRHKSSRNGIDHSADCM